MKRKYNLKAEIRLIYLSKLISIGTMRLAIKDLNKMLNDESYAKRVAFNRDKYNQGDIMNMMIWDHTEGGRTLWNHIRAKQILRRNLIDKKKINSLPF